MDDAIRILVVDDDAGIRDVIVDSLSAQGYRVHTAQDARTMDRALAEQRFDLLILDVLMPGENGIAISRRLSLSPRPPVIMLSALDQSHDRVKGLESGADYYLGKPCNPRELLAVVRATLRRTTSADASEMSPTFGFLGWTVDFSARELRDPSGVLVHLTDGEFVMLKAFVERPRRVLTRDHLLNVARGRDAEIFDRAVDVQVSRLRRKLRAPDDELIRTIRNEGYMFVPSVQRL